MKMLKKIALSLCALAAVICITSAVPAKAEAATKHYVTTRAVTLTTKATANSGTVLKVPSGSFLTLKSSSDKNFYRVTYRNSRGKAYTGYVPKGKIREVTSMSIDASTNVYAKKSTTSKKLSTLSKGKTVYILSTSSSYKRVAYTSGNRVITGYIKYKTSTKAKKKAPAVVPTYKALNTVNIRSAASNDSEILGRVAKGAKVTIVNDSNKYWAKITYKTKKGSITGFVSKRYLTK